MELTIDIYWEGAFSSFEEVSKHIEEDEIGKNTDYFFYQIYGDHVTYGKDVLLYIGISGNYKSNGIVSRLKSHHNNWTNGLCSEIKIYIGSYGLFNGWNNWYDKDNKYYKFNPELKLPTINMMESLLIYAHKPIMNRASISGLFKVNMDEQCDLHKLDKIPTFRIFNTGKRKSLLPELSTTYYSDDPKKRKI